MKYVAGLAGLFACLLFVINCGGGGGGGGQSGSLLVQVDWPGRLRSVPTYAESIRVRIQNTNKVVVINRVDDSPHSGAVILSSLPVGTASVVSEAYSQPGGQGTIVATATVPTTIANGAQSQLNITADLSALVASVELSAPTTSLEVTELIQLAATARDAGGSVLLLPARAYVWEIISGSENASISNSGQLRGTMPGSATVRVREADNVTSDSKEFLIDSFSRIIYQSDPPATGGDSISSMRFDGSDSTVIIPSSLGNPRKPVISWNGDRIAFTVSVALGGGLHVQEIFLADPNGANITRLTFTQPNMTSLAENAALDFSPDGTELLVLRHPLGGGQKLIRVRVSDGLITEVLTSTSDSNDATGLYDFGWVARFPASGNEIYYIAQGWRAGGGSLQSQVFKTSLDGLTRSQVFSTLTKIYGFDLSPAETQIAYLREPDLGPGPLDVFIADISGMNEVQLTNNQTDKLGPIFTRDGTALLYSDKTGAQFDIHRVSVMGGGSVNLTNHPGRDINPAIAKN